MAKEYKVKIMVWTSEGTFGNNRPPTIVAPRMSVGRAALKALMDPNITIYDPCDGCSGANGECPDCCYSW